jgi:hypothetical protein
MRRPPSRGPERLCLRRPLRAPRSCAVASPAAAAACELRADPSSSSPSCRARLGDPSDGERVLGGLVFPGNGDCVLRLIDRDRCEGERLEAEGGGEVAAEEKLDVALSRCFLRLTDAWRPVPLGGRRTPTVGVESWARTVGPVLFEMICVRAFGRGSGAAACEFFYIYFYHDFAKIYGPSEISQNYTSATMTHGVRDIMRWSTAVGAASSGPLVWDSVVPHKVRGLATWATTLCLSAVGLGGSRTASTVGHDARV